MVWAPFTKPGIGDKMACDAHRFATAQAMATGRAKTNRCVTHRAKSEQRKGLTMLRIILVIAVALAVIIGLTQLMGRDKDAAVTETQSAIENTAEDAGDAMENAADATGDMMDDAADAAGDMMEDAGDAVEGAMDDAGEMADDAADAMEEAADDAGDAVEEAGETVAEEAEEAADEATEDTPNE